MYVGVVGYGVVGHALVKLFGGEQNVRIYDKYNPSFNSAEHKDAINDCDLVLVGVPTPMSADGSADVSAVEEVVSWIEAPVCIKSTIPPGTCDRLSLKYGKPVCFSPEYVGETRWHPFKQIETHGFVIVGGPKDEAKRVVEAYQEVLGPMAHYYTTTARTAELVKYMENCFFATKVAFVNQFYDLCQGFGVDFNEVRELWLADSRVSRSHTLVTAERGFGGRCLPKDLSAIIYAAHSIGGAPLLEAVQQFNASLRARTGGEQPARAKETLADGARAKAPGGLAA
jgi:UDPglucose 6-dehydrogenase